MLDAALRLPLALRCGSNRQSTSACFLTPCTSGMQASREEQGEQMSITSASVRADSLSIKKLERSGRRAKGLYAIAIAAAAVPVTLLVREARADIFGFGDGTTATGWQLNGSVVPVAPATGTTV